MSVSSVTQCASVAVLDPQDQLLCFNTTNVCTKYNFRVGAKHNDSSSGPVTSCWTRHLTGPAFNTPFAQLVAEGCIEYVSTPETWHDARKYCRSIGGDLYVAGDYTGMKTYITLNGERQTWVGVANWTWLDGRPVDASEWVYFGEPDNGPDEQCARYRLVFAGLDDFICTMTHAFLCQKGISYP
ncbi:hypothetical protein Pcinc_039511 [Petrolisthes cinctipes]|uniref:C-type lectin domain-containing protein n=1 Tax=Petrolisthes cinctipes TaxID=88211 RepID=A0AAE1BR31_PETCI|nr:hypothetical protein Pcinc_039511 [Petrolisthes cinctipes]